MPTSLQQKHTYAFLHGCGWRRVGGSYIVSNLSKYAPETLDGKHDFHPLAYFMADPPIPINEADYGMSPQGISFIKDRRTGIVNAYDWIGASFYPNASDIWEEMAALNPDGTMHGGSALATINDQWNELQPGVSKRFLVHPRGYFGNPAPYRENWIETGLEHCMLPEFELDGTPTKRELHLTTPTEMCAALWWQCVEGVTLTKGTSRAGVRTVGSTSYPAAGPIKNVDPVYQPAIIGWVPIDEIHVIAGDVKNNPKDINDKIKATLLRLQSMSLQLPIFVTPA